MGNHKKRSNHRRTNSTPVANAHDFTSWLKQKNGQGAITLKQFQQRMNIETVNESESGDVSEPERLTITTNDVSYHELDPMEDGTSIPSHDSDGWKPDRGTKKKKTYVS